MLARILYYYYKAMFLNNFIKTPGQLKNHQEKQWQQLQVHVLSKLPFYKGYMHKPFNEWPVINKQIMMAHFDELNTAGISKKLALEVALKAEQTRDFSPLINGVSVGLSSGTSGTRGLFLANARERDVWAGTILAKALPNGLKTRERIAFFLRANNNLYTTLDKSTKIQFYFFDLLEDLDAHIHQLNAINPTIISAPASVLSLLASQKHRLTSQPKKIFSVAEVLEQKEEQRISDAFACRVSQIYQCTEGFLAISDKRSNHLVLNEEFLIIEKEWLDEQRFVPIITDLFRSTQPIIRYRLDDVLILRKSAGIYTELAGIEGRTGDICYAKQGDKIIPIFADSLRQCMVTSQVEFVDYQICQERLNEFTIQIFPESANKAYIVEHLNQLFKQKNCDIPNWQWIPYQKKALDLKVRRIQSKLK